MPRLPDRFDLWVRKARACADPARQADYVLGALMALPAWHFLNLGPAEKPEPAAVEMEGARLVLVFSDADRVAELAGDLEFPSGVPVFSLPRAQALEECLGTGPFRADGLLVNPGQEPVAVPHDRLEAFVREWREQGGDAGRGFWIPNLTSEEEDFWQEHGL